MPLAADAEIHLALEHPDDLLVRMPVRTGVRARLDFPPHDHSMLSRNDAALDFIGDALPRQFRKRAEPGHHRHHVSSVATVQKLIAALECPGLLIALRHAHPRAACGSGSPASLRASTSAVCSPRSGSRRLGTAGSWRKRIGGATWRRPDSSVSSMPRART